MVNQEQCKNLIPGEILYYDGEDSVACALPGDVSFKEVWEPNKDGSITDVIVYSTVAYRRKHYPNTEQIISIANLYIKGTE